MAATSVSTGLRPSRSSSVGSRMSPTANVAAEQLARAGGSTLTSSPASSGELGQLADHGRSALGSATSSGRPGVAAASASRRGRRSPARPDPQVTLRRGRRRGARPAGTARRIAQQSRTPVDRRRRRRRPAGEYVRGRRPAPSSSVSRRQSHRAAPIRTKATSRRRTTADKRDQPWRGTSSFMVTRSRWPIDRARECGQLVEAARHPSSDVEPEERADDPLSDHCDGRRLRQAGCFDRADLEVVVQEHRGRERHDPDGPVPRRVGRGKGASQRPIGIVHSPSPALPSPISHPCTEPRQPVHPTNPPRTSIAAPMKHPRIVAVNCILLGACCHPACAAVHTSSGRTGAQWPRSYSFPLHVPYRQHATRVAPLPPLDPMRFSKKPDRVEQVPHCKRVALKIASRDAPGHRSVAASLVRGSVSLRFAHDVGAIRREKLGLEQVFGTNGQGVRAASHEFLVSRVVDDEPQRGEGVPPRREACLEI